MVERRLLRSLPSGLVDEYIVDEPGFLSSFGGIPAHFQTKVRRSGAPAAHAGTIINNIQGQNARVNINSTDNSQNLTIDARGAEIFSAMRDRLENSAISEEDARALREAIERMEKASSKEGFKESYQNFMAAAANHVAVFGPLLSALAGLL